MRIRRFTVENIRSFKRLDWFPPDPNASWNVVLGNNGTGKSSLLRCMSLAIVGPREAVAARQEWKRWLPHGAASGHVTIEILPDEEYDRFSGQGSTGRSRFLTAGVTLAKAEDGSVTPEKTLGTRPPQPDRHIWGPGSGWFSAAYGPFRRFSGGDKDAERTYLSDMNLAAHISVFGEEVALTESLVWLKNLHYQRLEDEKLADRSSYAASLLDCLTKFVNQQGFLPSDVELKNITSKGVEFVDANGYVIPVEDLGDGYRSVLSMTFELIRQLADYYEIEDVFSQDKSQIIAPGVVLIDEVDAHLHPSWQKEIGFWLTRHFPKIQFIVTTHSPLVCHAAIHGSIFRLPDPGTDEKARFVEGVELERLLYGDILDGLSTSAFGVPDTRSDEAYALQDRLADMNLLELKKALTPLQKAEQLRLRQTFPTLANALSLKQNDTTPG